MTAATTAPCSRDYGGWRRPEGQSAAGSPRSAHVASDDLHLHRCPANDAKPAWAIRWAAAVTPQYPSYEACAAGPCIYNLAFDRRPLLADSLEHAVCIDAGILAHCREPGEHVRGCWVVDALFGKSRGG